MDSGESTVIDENGQIIQHGDWVRFYKQPDDPPRIGKICDMSITGASVIIEGSFTGLVLCSTIRERIVKLSDEEMMLVKLENCK